MSRATPGAATAPQFSGARSVARKLALQALYRWQLNSGPWQDLVQEFADAEDMPRADRDYFVTLIAGVTGAHAQLEERLAQYCDRETRLLDPIEHAALLIGLYELEFQSAVPYRAAINEAVQLARRFGATDGHKFVNAVLDRAARTLRPAEH